MSKEELKQAFEWCQKNGNAEDWDLLAIAYYSAGYLMNALAYFKKADEMRANLAVTLKNPEPLDVGIYT